ncbi:MAG: ArnT family glycosyltransferase [Thiotrichales bacterium]
MNNRLGSDFSALWLIPLIGLSFFLGLGAIPLFDLDEGAFTEATREMLASGNFVTTYLNGELRFDKPILIYWLQAASVTFFGLSEWSLRLPSAIAASGWIIAIFYFVRARAQSHVALFAALLAACSAAVVIIGRAATADALLNLFLVLTMLDIYRDFESPSNPKKIRVFLWMGLAVLTKGPVGIIIPFATSLLFYTLEKRFSAWLKAIFCYKGWLVFLAVVLPWYVMEYLDQGQAFIDGFILKHNLSRFSSTMEGHGGSVFYYFGAIFLVVLPFSGAVIWSALNARKIWAAEALNRYLMIWFVIVFGLFSFSNTQLPHYILYGCTPLFMLWSMHDNWATKRLLMLTLPMLFAAALLILPEIIGQQAASENNEYVRSMLELAATQMTTGYRLSALALLMIIVVVFIFMPRRPLASMSLLGIAFSAFITQALLPVIGSAQQQPVKDAAMVARSLNEPVVMWATNMPSFSVYRGAITPQREPLPGELVFTRINKLQELGPHQILYSKGGITLARKGGGR